MANKQDKLVLQSASELVKNNIVLRTVEVMKVLGITRSTFDKLKKEANFPKPRLFISKSRPVWLTEEIVNWCKKWN